MTDDSDQRTRSGERVSPHWTYQFIDLSRIEAGELIVPGKIDSDEGREFAALNLIQSDLRFSLECFSEANKLGMPDSENTRSKALIFSAVVAYARPFKTGVREIKLDKNVFASLKDEFSTTLHDFLIDVRDKHVAHSVNEFERCEPTTVMVGTPQTSWRMAGIGFTTNQTIGLSGAIVDQAIDQTTSMLGLLYNIIEKKRASLFEMQRAQFEANGRWEQAPLVTFPSRENVSKRRR
jgi:hypothetical protein